MTVAEIAKLSGYSRQRINKLVDIVPAHASGIRRKPSRRLEVVDERIARRWCEFLRNRKSARRKRNLQRKEWRDRLKLRRLMLAFDPAPLLSEVRAQTASKLMDTFKDQFGHMGFADHLWRGLAEEVSRREVASRLRATEFASIQFALRGRKPETKAARSTLFDWLTGNIPADWYKSYEDIARDYGCTRAALYAAAKQLPPSIPRRSGRIVRGA